MCCFSFIQRCRFKWCMNWTADPHHPLLLKRWGFTETVWTIRTWWNAYRSVCHHNSFIKTHFLRGSAAFFRSKGIFTQQLGNLVSMVWIILHWVSYLLANAVLLFGSYHYGSIGNKQMSSSAWQSTMMNNHGVAELWESQGTDVTMTKSHMSVMQPPHFCEHQSFAEIQTYEANICIKWMLGVCFPYTWKYFNS